MSVRLLLLLSVFSAAAGAATFQSPNGVTEECTIAPQIPGGKYAKDDIEEEQMLCSIDFYNNNDVAICPKTWSTSAGTMVYDIRESGLSQADYEALPKCGEKDGHEKITKFKQTMNMKGTSGTFSTSSLLYYHLSRYFDSSVKVPVGVYRSIDKDAHYDRVTRRAHERTLGKSKMNRAAWEWMYKIEKTPTLYTPIDEVFTPDRKQIYGAFSDGGGERYGEEINGVRSKWGDQQNIEFQETPGFYALRSELPLKEAIAEGLERGQRNAKIRTAMGGGASEFQMAVWMKELSEIVIFDYIFSQQDRVGNVDYKWYLYWRDASGKVESKKLDDDTSRANMANINVPADIDGSPVELVQRTRINDNDAGGRVTYTNYTKRTEMLEKIRHLDRETYDKLLALDADFQAQGPLYQYFSSNFRLDAKQLAQITRNTQEAAAILKATEAAGKMKFDLAGVKAMFKDLGKL